MSGQRQPWGECAMGPQFLQALEHARQACLPLTVQWEITRACNLRCAHCYYQPGAARGDLTTDEALHLLDDLAASGVLFLNFTGGEPLARRDFFTIAEAAASREFALRLLTNGTLIDDAVAARLDETGFTCIDVSILGDEATHDAITGVAGSYARVRQAVERLRAREQNVIIKMPVMRRNMGCYEHVRDVADAAGTGLVVDVQMVCRNDGDPSPTRLMASDDELAQFVRKLNPDESLQPRSNLGDDRPACNAGASLARIAHDGSVHACVASPAVLGSVRESPFSEIWRGEAFGKWREHSLQDLPVCRACELRSACLRCPGVAEAEGDFFGPSASACRMARIRLSAAKACGVPSEGG